MLAQEGWTMIIVTHEMQFAKDVADRVILMADGYIVEQNTADKFFTCPQHERTKQFLLQAKYHLSLIIIFKVRSIFRAFFETNSIMDNVGFN